MQEKGRPRVVIVGCGFGGLFAARALRRAPADVLVVDHNNYHLFQPLLYQVASAALAPADIAQPIRTILRDQANASVMLAEVDRANLDAQFIHAGDSRVPYDYLILAPGAVDNYFGHSQWHSFAPGMKEVEDATLIRSRLLRSFEAAEVESDPEERTAHLAFVIVGGGPTGVELAGAIKELAVDVIARDYRVADTRRARVILIEAGPRLLPAFHPDSSERALKQLQGLGVEVLLGKPVTTIHEDSVDVGGERVRSYNVIWAAGVRASPLMGTLGAEVGPGGRVKSDVGLLGTGPSQRVCHWRCGLSGRFGHGTTGAGGLAGRAADGAVCGEGDRDGAERRSARRWAPRKGFHYKDLGLHGHRG